MNDNEEYVRPDILQYGSYEAALDEAIAAVAGTLPIWYADRFPELYATVAR